jgi:hypothetical protein
VLFPRFQVRRSCTLGSNSCDQHHPRKTWRMQLILFPRGVGSQSRPQAGLFDTRSWGTDWLTGFCGRCWTSSLEANIWTQLAQWRSTCVQGVNQAFWAGVRTMGGTNGVGRSLVEQRQRIALLQRQGHIGTGEQENSCLMSSLIAIAVASTLRRKRGRVRTFDVSTRGLNPINETLAMRHTLQKKGNCEWQRNEQ